MGPWIAQREKKHSVAELKKEWSLIGLMNFGRSLLELELIHWLFVY